MEKNPMSGLVCEVKPMRRRRRGFTLIELLVVIAMIALLASLMMPVVKKMRMRAMGVMFQSNLRQVASAMLLWAQDHNGRIMPFYEYELGPASMWQHRILPYLNEAKGTPLNRSVMRDPIVRPPSGVNPGNYRCMAINGKGLGDSYPNAYVRTAGASNRSLFTITYPSKLCLVGAGGQDPLTGKSSPWGSGGSLQTYDVIVHGVDKYIRYDDGNYFAFVDGHTEFKTRAWLLAEALNSPWGHNSRFFDPRALNP